MSFYKKIINFFNNTFVLLICVSWPFIGFSLVNRQAITQNLNQVHDFSFYDIFKYGFIYLIIILLITISLKLIFKRINLNYLASIIAALSISFTTFHIFIVCVEFLDINRILSESDEIIIQSISSTDLA